MQSWYENYDELIGKICPNYEVALNSLVKKINGAEVMELGCGTGNLTEKLVRNGNKIIAHDSDNSMLKIARKKLSRYEEVTFVCGDVSDVTYYHHQVIVSSLLFHLLDDDKRNSIFERVSEVGADLYIFDRIRGESDDKEKLYQEHFRKNLNSLPEVIVSELTKENQTNNPYKLSEQRKYFERKGYEFRILFQDPEQGFVTYCFLKK